MELHKKKCVPCRGDIPAFSKQQIDEYLKYLTDWEVQINEKKAFYLSRFCIVFFDSLVFLLCYDHNFLYE